MWELHPNSQKAQMSYKGPVWDSVLALENDQWVFIDASIPCSWNSEVRMVYMAYCS